MRGSIFVAIFVSCIIASSGAAANVIIEYEEVGSDLVFDYSGSLQLTGSGSLGPNSTNPFSAIGNQSSAPEYDSVFYSNPEFFVFQGNFPAAFSSNTPLWNFSWSGFLGSTSGNTFMFRADYFRSTVDLFLNNNYTAGSDIFGTLTIFNRSIADTGVTPQTFDIQSVGSITVQAASDDPAAPVPDDPAAPVPDDPAAPVPSPGTLALLSLGLIGLARARRKA